MPNGGPDNCGTCEFNTRSWLERLRLPRFVQDSTCAIRGYTISNAFWTYCANQSFHNPDKIQIPVGPIFVDMAVYQRVKKPWMQPSEQEEDRKRLLELVPGVVGHFGGSMHYRQVWMQSPDTEVIRKSLLEMLDQMSETPAQELLSPTKLEEAVILQLGEFRERRAIPGLRRVIRFNPDATSKGEAVHRHDRTMSIAYAIEALARVSGDDALPEIRFGLQMIHSGSEEGQYQFEDDRYAVIRAFAVLALKYCALDVGEPEYAVAMADQHPLIRELATEMYKGRKG